MQTIDNAKDDIAAQLRFESFKLGKPLPTSMTLNHQHKHSRSHSRNGSVSSVASLPLTASKSTNSYDFAVLPTTNSMPVLSSKRNSHHRRRSSVSTRHESADIMGLPELPASSSEDNVIEKDYVRRRALWALEGKQNDASFSKVEIPELSSSEVEKKMFDFSSKSFSTPSNSGYGKRESFKPSSSKDQLHTLVEEEEEEEDWDFQKSSPRKLPVSAVSLSNDDKLPTTPVTPDDAFAKQTASRPRPATLTLRPLSLTAGGLPTPSLTPSVRPGLRSLSLVPNDEQTTRNSFNDVSPTPYLRARPANLQISTSRGSVDETSCAIPIRRSSISYKSSAAAAGLPTPEMTPTFSERRYSHNSLGSNTSVSGISNDEDFLQSNASYSRHRPLSASEQHFLFKSHNALLSRIQDLEKALIVRRTSVSSVPGSRPLSSSFSVTDSEDMSISSEPSDEMLRLVADLKAERDELKRDVDGWRVRVGDLEKQIGLLGKRVEGERREAWVARSRTNLLEAEKNTFEKEYGQAKEEMARMEEEKNKEIAQLTAQVRTLEADKQRTIQDNAHLSGECEYWKVEAARFSKMRKDEMLISTVRSTYDTEHAPSAWRRGLHYDSVDSLESSTDVDFGSFDSDHGFGFSLKAVAEENEGDLDVHGSQIPEEDVEADYLSDEEDNGLAGYEDEEEEDFTFQSSGSSSSFGSIHEISKPRSATRLQMDVLMPSSPAIRASTLSSGSGSNTPSTLTPGSRSLSSSPVPSVASNMDALKSTRVQATVVPVHRSVGSLSKTWTFPRAQSASTSHDPRNDVDKFFDCLEDSETDSTGSRSPVSPSIYTYEHNKGLFAKGLEAFDDNEAMPFALPSNIISMVVEEQDSPRSLPVVIEEEEVEDDDEQTRVDDDDDMLGDNAGIKITLTPAAEDDNDEYLSSHIEDSDEEETDADEENDEIAQQDRTVNVHDTETHPRFKSTRKPVPVFEEFDEGNDDDDVPFNFGQPLRSSTPPHTLAMTTPPRSSVRISSPSPSSIPRPTSSFNTSTSSPNILESSPTITLSKLPVRPTSSFVTPPTKRGGAMSSFIPLPITSSSPSPMRKQPSVREKPLVASFIRQPVRRPLMAANSSTSSTSRAGHNDSNGSAIQSSFNFVNSSFGGAVVTNDPPRFSLNSPSFSSSQSYSGSFQTDIDGLNGFAPISTLVSTSTATNFVQPISTDEQTLQSSFSSPSLSSIMSSPKLSFQVLAGFIPRPWNAQTSVLNVDQDDAIQRGDLFTTPAGAKFKSYVSKQKQLERLRLRLQHESSPPQHLSNDVCQKCDGAVVYL
ncbi:uncharacterized protein C8R40DRAFT_1264931 [Lentinula edodes]|uniref:uncharacterized protein n=1 Tax=Lentinula edodes TaxID=5353 RepID=UPI001E8CD96C|nr:uncharacterized protein C8R40DRAFT_1264931 [Lentinula edodes]KAH7875981.1 hypothetical protein C8R40DRAFT_1264931 [Lentinula edodes]